MTIKQVDSITLDWFGTVYEGVTGPLSSEAYVREYSQSEYEEAGQHAYIQRKLICPCPKVTVVMGAIELSAAHATTEWTRDGDGWRLTVSAAPRGES